MQQINDYSGPDADDYANVHALNRAYVKATSDLKGPQQGRLANAPFLLFSLRETDLEWWADALIERRQTDLIAASEISDPELRRIQTAALSFLWQICQRNPYAARVLTGATIAWCEKIIELPLLTLLNRIAARDDLMVSRLEPRHESAACLLAGGISSKPQVRRSSQLSTLQTLLTNTGLDEYARFSSAACSMTAPARVRDKKV